MNALRISRWLMLLLVAVVPRHGAAIEIAPYNAVYDISKGVLKLGTMRRHLNFDRSGAYVFESRIETRGLAALFGADEISETSRGRFDGARFLPEHYEYVRTGGKRNFSLHFDYQTGIVRSSDRASDWVAEMPVNVLDKLVYQAQLMVDLSAAPDSLNYDIADQGKLKKYVIRNLGREKIQTTAGRFDTIKLQRSKEGSKRQTTVWCAAELAWIPIKVEHRDKKGRLTTALLRSIEQHSLVVDSSKQ
ncbi:MAG: DUF3108 domain-containing protein [Proteobacteria bacterium]|nr:DUF3108 domain-containing protein [Pseudomonadota bacterium]